MRAGSGEVYADGLTSGTEPAAGVRITQVNLEAGMGSGMGRHPGHPRCSSHGLSPSGQSLLTVCRRLETFA